ncbi:MAG: OadG family protein [Bacteroidota bacterium]
MGIDNIIAGDGIGLAITGMLIVFAGLIFISLYIAAIPRALEWAESQKQRREERRRPAPTAAASGIEDPTLRAAIALAIQLELENELPLDAQRITIQRDAAQNAWTFAGKMRTLSTRM